MSTPSPLISRLRLVFGKHGQLRWTGHLDLRQCWERTFRRAKLPLMYSAGHHPQPKLLFASPLPLGFTSDGELLDVWLEGSFSSVEVERRLGETCPPGLQLREARLLSEGEPQVTKLVAASQYQVRLDDAPVGIDLRAAIADLLEAKQLMRERRGRAYDLRPMVEQLAFDEQDNCLDMRLSCLPSQTGRPEEVLRQLSLDPTTCTIHRREQVLRAPDAK